MKFSLLLAGLASAVLAVPSPVQTSSPRAPTSYTESRAARYGRDITPLAKKDLRSSLNNHARGLARRNTEVFTDWKTFKAHGVNMGGWLLQEKGLQPSFFEDNGASAAIDESSFCAVLGSCKCGRLLEERYATFYTTDDIDMFAEYGINLLRIPVGYWAFMEPVNGETFHHGNQLLYLKNITNYATSKGMHIIIDIHGLPGGQNGFDNSGQSVVLNWWHNETNFNYSLQAVGLATDFILEQPTSTQYTLSVINEPLPASSATVFSGGNVTDSDRDYLNSYYSAAIEVIRAKDPEKRVPIMLTDTLNGPLPWVPYWGNSTDNIVWDTHIYFFYNGEYAYSAPYSACYLAKAYTDTPFPVFVGEWSIEASSFNSLDVTTRSTFYYTQLEAWKTYLSGGSFWTGKNFGTDIVGIDNSTNPNYWSWELIAEQGVVVKPGEHYDYLTCNTTTTGN
ncbi:glycoside hydrolase superfamily [Xylariales sp. PMI_506]|nr:glycoside hydrolase superfamily [Xylariales sp. PMI_506]